MTVIAMPLPNMITRDSEGEIEFKEIRSQFGDGYSQSSPDGLNNTLEIWNITWAPLTQAQRNTVIDALRSVGTWGTITWTPCDEVTERKFQLEGKIKFGRVRKGMYKVSCTIREDFRV